MKTENIAIIGGASLLALFLYQRSKGSEDSTGFSFGQASGGEAYGGSSSGLAGATIVSDSFNSPVTTNVSAPSYTYTSISKVANAGVGAGATDTPTTKKDTNASLSQAITLPASLTAPTSSGSSSGGISTGYIAPSSSSIGGYSFTASGRGTLMSTPSSLYTATSTAPAGNQTQAIPTTKKESAPVSSAPVAWYNTPVVRYVAPVVSRIGNLFSGGSKKK